MTMPVLHVFGPEGVTADGQGGRHDEGVIDGEAVAFGKTKAVLMQVDGDRMQFEAHSQPVQECVDLGPWLRLLGP